MKKSIIAGLATVEMFRNSLPGETEKNAVIIIPGWVKDHRHSEIVD